MMHQLQKIMLWLLAVQPLMAAAQQELLVPVGFSSPLSGSQAAAGIDNQGGLQMAIDQLNRQGLVIGGRKVQFTALMQDDQADPRAGVSVAQLLVDAGVKAVIGPYNSGVTIPASRIYERAGIPMLSVSTNARLTQQGFKSVFRLVDSDAQFGSKIAAYAAQQLKIKSVAVVDDRTAYGQGLAASFTKAAEALGVQIADVEYTSDKASDFNAILTAIKRKKPDAIFFGGYAQQGGPMLRQIRQLGLNSLFLGGDGICNSETGKLAGDALQGQVYCVSSSAAGQGRLTFNAAYEKRFHRQPDYYAIFFYDGLLMVAEAMKMAGSIEPANYRPVLEKLRYQGAARNYAFDASHDQLEAPAMIYRFQNGLPVPVMLY